MQQGKVSRDIAANIPHPNKAVPEAHSGLVSNEESSTEIGKQAKGKSGVRVNFDFIV
jgi:hypothetical protein